jgi:hypothetical protein
MTNETNTETRYGVTLVKTHPEVEGAFPLEFKDEIITHYRCSSSFTEQELIEHFGNKDRVQRVIRAGLEAAMATYGVLGSVATEVKVYEDKQNPDFLEVTPKAKGRKSKVPIINTLWDQLTH